MGYKQFLMAGLAILASWLPAFSATYYISPNGNDSSGDGSTLSPWKTSTKAFAQGGGHTYIFKDGTYNYIGGPIENPPSGTATSPTVIRAENDGRAILDGQASRSGIRVNQKQYVFIEGFRVENCGENPAIHVTSPDGTAIASQCNNIIIRRTGAKGSAQSSNNPVWAISRTRDSLFEDVWGWGFGRYTMNVYGCTNVIVRRAVLRWDGWGAGADKPGDPKFNMGVYDTHDSLFENILILDAANDPFGGDKGGLFVPGNNNGNTAPYADSDNNTFLGLIVLNNIGRGVGVEGGTGGTNDNNRFVDLVTWGNTSAGITVHKKASNTQFNHVTSGFNDRGTYFGSSANSVSGSTLTNSLVYANITRGVDGPVSTSYNNVYANGTNYLNGASAGPNSISQDPLLAYILRIESNSPNKGTASDGGDRGANVLKKYVNRALASEDLWPWPYQDRIKADMCAGVSRGFCGTAWASLTNYVWGQFNNSTPDTSSPSIPSNLSLANPTTSSLTLSWSPSTDNIGVAGYRLDVSTDPSFGNLVTGYNNKDLGRVTQTVISGLSSQTTYHVRLRAYDAAGNISGNSSAVSRTTLAEPDTTPPSVPSNLALSNPTPSSLTLLWTASTDNTGVAGYRLDVSTDISFASFVTGYNNKDSGNVTQAIISGLSPQTTYHVRLRAYDAAGNVSPNSASVSDTTQPASSCLTATYPTSRWQNLEFPSQAGLFMAEADVTPSASNVDAAISVSSGPQSAWNNLAVTVLFFTDGRIKAIDGADYTTGTIAYSANTTYRVRMVIDVATHTYSAYVAAPGGSEQIIGENLAFRAGQEAATALSNWTLSADAGSIEACNLTVAPSSACLTATYPASQWQNQGFAAQNQILVAEADVTPSATNIDAGISVSNNPQTSWDGLAATVLFFTDGHVKAIDGTGYRDSGIAYTANTTYRVRMVIDVTDHTYSAYLTPAGGSEQLIGADLQFRTGQEALASLNNWVVVADSGSLRACNLRSAPLQHLTLQQNLNGYAGVTDTWINYYDPNLNFNNETKLNVHGTEDIKTLIRFDLSSIPAGAKIISATLSLYNYSHSASASGGTLSAYSASKPWIESQATWNICSTGNSWAAAGLQAGADYRTSPASSITIDTAINVWRELDVSTLVQEWVNGSVDNNGFVVRSPTGGVKPRFYSSGFLSNPLLRPKLTVTY